MQQKQLECKPSRHKQPLNQSASSRSRHNKNHVLPKRGTMLKSIPCYYQILRTFQNAQVYEDQAELEGIIKQAAKERLRLERQLAQRPVCTEFSYIVVISEICSPVMEIRQLLKNSSELLISRVQKIRIKH